MKKQNVILFSALLMLVFFACNSFARTQSALLQENEKELSFCEKLLSDAAGDNAKTGEVCRLKAAMLNSCGRSEEALEWVNKAQALMPKSWEVLCTKAIISDSLGRHDEARKLFNEISQELSLILEKVKKRKKKDENTAEARQDIKLSLDMISSVSVPAALNRVALNEYDEALRRFNVLIRNETNGISRFEKDRDYAMMWSLRLIAKGRTAQGGKLKQAISKQVNMFAGKAPLTRAMVAYYQEKAAWEDVLGVINASTTSDAERENMRTEAIFFGAGFLRYVQHDNAAALALLKEEDARPFNGTVERFFISKEINSILKKQDDELNPPQVFSINPDPDTNGNPQGMIITLPRNMQKDSIRKALVAAFGKRGWIVAQQSDEQVKGTIDSRGTSAQMTAKIETDRIITQVSGSEKDGRARTNWISNKHKDISVEIENILPAGE